MFDFTMTALAPVGGFIDFPMLAAFIGWFLLAALVGSALGILRQATSPGFKAAAPARPVSRIRPTSHSTADHAHQAAA